MTSDPRETIASTLESAAEWFPVDLTSDDTEAATKEPSASLKRAAMNVRHEPRDGACCPLCQEVRCDEGCPMKEWRTFG